MICRLGHVPDTIKVPGQTPDRKFSELAKDFKSLSSMKRVGSARRLILDVLDQSALGSCVPNMGFQLVRANHIRQGILFPELGSRLMGYYLGRVLMHTPGIDSGLQIRLFFEALNKFGFCPERYWEYDISKFLDMPSDQAFTQGFDQRSPFGKDNPTNYFSIELDEALAPADARQKFLLDLCHSIDNEYPSGFGAPVSEAFVSNDFDAEQPLEAPTEDIAGGHAMVITDYAIGDDGKFTFDVLSSWTANWGNGGYAKFSENYIMDAGHNFWVVQHSPVYVGMDAP